MTGPLANGVLPLEGASKAAFALRLPAVLTHDQASQCALELKNAMASPSGPGGSEVVVDASALKAFDSSALAVLLECRRNALALGKSFSVHHLPEKLRQLAGLYGVAELMPAGR